MNEFQNSIQSIKGIGPKKAALFNKLGVKTIEDALNYFPREYEQRGAIQPVVTIQEGMAFLCLQWKGYSPVSSKPFQIQSNSPVSAQLFGKVLMKQENWIVFGSTNPIGQMFTSRIKNIMYQARLSKSQRAIRFKTRS